jgi:SAM-dependent methyltransferase
VKRALRDFDARHNRGRARRWWMRNAVLGGTWGDFLDAVAAVPDGALVLDVGAGEAELRARLPRARYVAVDRGIGHAGWDYSRLDALGDAQALPVAAGVADVVVHKQVLEHLTQPVEALREVARVLKPGGRVLLSTNQQWPQHQQPHDYFRFTSYGLRFCFEQAGLEVEKIEAMGGAFSVALFGFSQTLAPHLWTRGERARRVFAFLTKPFAWLLRALMPLVSALDRLDRGKDNTLGYYVVGRKPTD